MFYEGYHFWGMHLIWWIIWIMFLFWVFATPYYIPGRPVVKTEAFAILKNRYAMSEISKKEYDEMKKFLETN